MENEITTHGQTLDAAVCSIRGCRIYPASDLAAHEQRHRDAYNAMFGSWITTKTHLKARGRPRGLSDKVQEVVGAIVAAVAEHPEGLLLWDLAAHTARFYGSLRSSKTRCAELVRRGLVPGVHGVKEGIWLRVIHE